ncbi:MAG: DMT family transporter [Gemmatimonadetes bacterium]|nr:DMT family transporter [Gemmatimonadota bacterium]
MSRGPQRSSRTQLVTAHLALAGAQIIFGLLPVIAHAVFAPGGLSPLAVGAWRVVAGSVVLFSLATAMYGRAVLPGRGDVARFVVAACLGVGLNQALYLEGLARSTPFNATLVMCLIPVFTFALATAVGLERFSVTRLAGVLIALAGTLPLLLDRGLTALGPYGLGNLLMVANTLSYSGYLIVSKPLVRRYPPIVVIAWSYALSLPFVPYFVWGERLAPLPGHAAAWWSLGYIIVFPTVIAYLFNMFALARVQASTTAIYIYAQPLITGLASWVALGERPTRPMLLAVPALFAGIWLVSRRPQDSALAASG